MATYDELINFIGSAKVFSALSSEQKQRVNDKIKQSRKFLSHEGQLWLARIYRRAILVGFSDFSEDIKRKEQALSEYGEARIADDIWKLSGGSGNFWEVVEEKNDLAKKRPKVGHQLKLIIFKNAQGKDKSVDEIYTELNSLGANEEDYINLPPGKDLLKFPNDSKWVLAPLSKEEGRLMHHCGGIDVCGKVYSHYSGSESLSYRIPHEEFFKPVITCLYFPQTKTIGARKGPANEKPSEDYYFAFVELFKAGVIEIDKVDNDTYNAQSDFELTDLNPKQYEEVAKYNPELVKLWEIHEKIRDENGKLIPTMVNKIPGKKDYLA